MTSIRSSSPSSMSPTFNAQPSTQSGAQAQRDANNVTTGNVEAGENAADAKEGEGESADIASHDAAGARPRVQQKGKARDSSKSTAADASDGGETSTKSSSDNSAKRSGKSKKAKDTRSDKKGNTAKASSGTVRRADGKDRNEAVEQVSVLVGQDDGGDALEQAGMAKNLFVAEDEHQNAFTGSPIDDFDPSLEPVQVERLGSIQGAVYMVKLTDYWQESGWDRQAIVEATARKLLGFARSDQAKKLLKEMSAAPIKCVYPLEIMLQVLDENPEFLPKVSRGSVLQNRDEIAAGTSIQAGREFLLRYPAKAHIVDFAVLGGGDVGYEFAPYKNGVHYMIIDTPGDWTCAIASQELSNTTVESFTVHVNEAKGYVDEEYLSF